MITKKILIVQRVITSYRLDLLKELCSEFDEVGIVTSQGDDTGTLKKANYELIESSISNLTIYELNAFKIRYKGDSRSTSLFLYPKILKLISKYDVLLLEGTTNILNNSYIIPFARLLRKKIVWWDSGYSEDIRTGRRKMIDFLLTPFIMLTHIQMTYSTVGKNYLQQYMGAKNAFVNLNTINTTYFENSKDEINRAISEYKFEASKIHLLYVGVVEKRKKIEELIQIIQKLNSENDKFTLRIIGKGDQLETLKLQYSSETITFMGAIYDKEKLKQYYFSSDLFVLPGDGGLGILQSLLYGLPVVCIKGADGTELDYILDKEYILNHYTEIEAFLSNISHIDRNLYVNYCDKVSSKKWIKKLCEQL